MRHHFFHTSKKYKLKLSPPSQQRPSKQEQTSRTASTLTLHLWIKRSTKAVKSGSVVTSATGGWSPSTGPSTGSSWPALPGGSRRTATWGSSKLTEIWTLAPSGAWLRTSPLVWRSGVQRLGSIFSVSGFFVFWMFNGNTSNVSLF